MEYIFRHLNRDDDDANINPNRGLIQQTIKVKKEKRKYF